MFISNFHQSSSTNPPLKFQHKSLQPRPLQKHKRQPNKTPQSKVSYYLFLWTWKGFFSYGAKGNVMLAFQNKLLTVLHNVSLGDTKHKNGVSLGRNLKGNQPILDGSTVLLMSIGYQPAAAFLLSFTPSTMGIWQNLSCLNSTQMYLKGCLSYKSWNPSQFSLELFQS